MRGFLLDVSLMFREEEMVALTGTQAQHSGQNQIIPQLVVNISFVSEEGFKKMCLVQQAYRKHCQVEDVSIDEIEALTFNHLLHDPFIEVAFQEAARSSIIPFALPQTLLPRIYHAFRHDYKVPFYELVREHDLTYGEIQDILLILLRRQLFAEYLLWQHRTTLAEWVDEHKQDLKSVRQRLVEASSWVMDLPWWQGEVA